MSDGDVFADACYREQCPKCGARLLGFTKQDYVAHLRENGETLAAEIQERFVVRP